MRLLCAALLAALLVATVPATAQSPPTGGCARSGTVITCDVQIHELGPGGPFHVLPERIEANVGDTLTLIVTNKAEGPHNLVVCGDGKAPSQTCAAKWAFTNNIDTNATRTETIASLPKGGTFYYFCLLPGHAATGMNGELKIAGEKKAEGTALVGSILALATVALVLRRK
jgi:plastocyanin